MDLVELPAPEEYSPWIKPGGDAMRIDRAERLAAAVRLKAVRPRGGKSVAMNRRVMSLWEMQTFGRLFFQFRAKMIALDVVSQLWIEPGDSNRAKDQQNCDRCDRPAFALHDCAREQARSEEYSRNRAHHFSSRSQYPKRARCNRPDSNSQQRDRRNIPFRFCRCARRFRRRTIARRSK